MSKALIILAMVLLLCCLPVLAQTEGEDLAEIKATVVGFGQDSSYSYITIYVDKIFSYQRAPNATYPELSENQTITLGFLWGHQAVGNGTGKIDVGSHINASIGYHLRFSSHTGHLYAFTLVCEENETLIEGECAPIECRGEEIRQGPKCVPLVCPEDSIAANHGCVNLDCKPYEIAANHECSVLECASDEAAVNHACQKLKCGLNSVIKDHACVPLVCGIFRRSAGSDCVFDWTQALVFAMFSAAFLFFIYYLFMRGIFERGGRKDQLLSKKPIAPLIFIISLVVICLPLTFRLILHGNFLTGDVSYYHTEIARQIMDGQLHYSLLGQGMSPYHLLVAALGNFIGIENAARVWPLLLSCLTACLFYLLMRKIVKDSRTAILSALILIFSPGFLFLATFSTPDCLVGFLLLLAILLSISGETIPLLISGLGLAMASIHSIFIYTAAVCIMLFLYIYLRNQRSLRLCLLLILVLVGGAYHIYNYEGFNALSDFRSNFVRDSITDLGGIEGVGIFSLILLFAGIIYTWKDKNKYYPVYIALFLLCGIAWLLNTNYNVYLNLIAAYLIGLGLMEVSNRKWEVDLLKNITLLILLCGLLFSSISYAKRVSVMEPDSSMVTGLQWLSVLPEGKVFSYPGYSSFISYFGKKNAIVPSEPRSDTAYLLNITDEIFHSRSLLRTQNLLAEENVSYLLIDSKMRQGLVWTREDQGLLFLLRNTETFRQIYQHDSTEIWEFLESGSPE